MSNHKSCFGYGEDLRPFQSEALPNHSKAFADVNYFSNFLLLPLMLRTRMPEFREYSSLSWGINIKSHIFDHLTNRNHHEMSFQLITWELSLHKLYFKLFVLLFTCNLEPLLPLDHHQYTTGNGFIEGTELDGFLREFVASANPTEVNSEVST